jgi:hypothetical protein
LRVAALGGYGEVGEGCSSTQAGERVLGATSTASLLTGVAYCTSWGSYEGRLPEIPRDLSRGSPTHAWWVSFGEQKRVSFAERQGLERNETPFVRMELETETFK